MRQKIRYLSVSTDNIDEINSKQRSLGYIKHDIETLALEEDETINVQITVPADIPAFEKKKSSGKVRVGTRENSSPSAKNGKIGETLLSKMHSKNKSSNKGLHHHGLEEVKTESSGNSNNAYYLEHGIDSVVSVSQVLL